MDSCICDALDWQHAVADRSVVDAISRSMALVEFTLDGTVISANENFLRLMGYRAAEVQGHPHTMFLDPAQIHAAQYAAFWNRLRLGEFIQAEFCRRAKDGREVWLQASYNPVLDAAGQPYKVVKMATDVTLERQSAAGYRGMVEAISRSTGLVEFTLDGTIVCANSIFLETMGYSESEIRGRHHRLFVDPAEAAAPAYNSLWDRLRAGEFVQTEFRRLGKGGREVWLQASYNPIFDAAGHPQKVMKIATDVTADRQGAADHRGIIEAISRSTALIEFQPNGTIISANDKLLKLLGYEFSEVRGRHHRMLIDPVEAATPEYAAFWDRLRAGEFVQREFRRLAKGGQEIWLQASYNPIFDAAGRTHKILKIATDITDTVHQRQSTARLASLDALTGLANRRSFDDRLHQECRRLTRSHSSLSLVLIDVDRFKNYNDLYGHPKGDRCLGMVAEALRRGLQRSSDFVARYGGEEFAMILPDTDTLGAVDLAERVRGVIERLDLPHAGNPPFGMVTASIGVATSHAFEAMEDIGQILLQRADAALYRAKDGGRNRVCGSTGEHPDQAAKGSEIQALTELRPG